MEMNIQDIKIGTWVEFDNGVIAKCVKALHSPSENEIVFYFDREVYCGSKSLCNVDADLFTKIYKDGEFPIVAGEWYRTDVGTKVYVHGFRLGCNTAVMIEECKGNGTYSPSWLPVAKLVGFWEEE